MLNVRGKAEGKEGECLNKFVIQYMWEKSYKRAKKLEVRIIRLLSFSVSIVLFALLSIKFTLCPLSLYIAVIQCLFTS